MWQTNGHLIGEAKELAKEFMDIKFSHVLRQSNSATHNIARYVRHVSEYSVWMEDVHPYLYFVIQADLASLRIKLQCCLSKKKKDFN